MKSAMKAVIGSGKKYAANAVVLDGSSYVYKTTELTGSVDGKEIELSFFFRTAAMGVEFYNFGVAGRVYLSSGRLVIDMNGISASSVLTALSAATDLDDGVWHHVYFSADLTDTGKRHMIIDRVDVTGTVTFSAYANQLINFSAAGVYASVGGNYDGGSHSSLAACELGEVYFNDAYRDPTASDNLVLRQFVTPLGKPAKRLPTGKIWLSGATDDWHTNKGTGGGFTEYGTLTTSSNPIIIGS